MTWAAHAGGSAPGESLRRLYTTLLESFGPQGWWPARTRWEVICGAILTQNTTWRNASLAIKNLRKARLLTRPALSRVGLPELELAIRPAGFYRQKAQVLQNIARWIGQAHGGSLNILFALPGNRARTQLLALKGIGPETADAILLYAGLHPTFVADAYTRRVLSRHQLISSTADYHSAQQFLHRHLPLDHSVFNEFHALLVETAKRHCHRNAMHCEECPLGRYLPPGGETLRPEGETRNSKLEIRRAFPPLPTIKPTSEHSGTGHDAISDFRLSSFAERT